MGVKRKQRYVHGIGMMRLCLYNGDNTTSTHIVNYTDADYSSGNEDRKFMSEIFIKYWDFIVHWRSIKQTSTETSNGEAEVNSTHLGLVEALWMWDIVREVQDEPIERWSTTTRPACCTWTANRTSQGTGTLSLSSTVFEKNFGIDLSWWYRTPGNSCRPTGSPRP